MPSRKLKPGPGKAPADVTANQVERLQQALIEVVAKRGYDTVKVRDVVQLANVSSRSLYQHFGSKDECFVRAYEAITGQARTGLIAVQAEGKDWRERSRRVFAAFAQGIERNPQAAHFALIDVYTEDSPALERAHHTEDNFTSMFSKSLARAPGGFAVPPLIVEGVMAGISHIARTRLRAGTEATVAGLEDEMMDWAFSFPTEESAELVKLDAGFVRGNAAVLEMRAQEAISRRARDDRAAILAAVSKLAAAEDYAYKSLTIPLIRRAAGVSRKVFDAEFDSVEECFLAALELRAAKAIADAATEQTAGATREGGVYRAISSLCTELAGDPLLARACFRNDFAPGSKGSQARLRIVGSVTDQIRAGAGAHDLVSDLATEASAGAIWALFHHHVLRNWVTHRPEIAATLAYMALAPIVGGANAVAAIRDEQIA